jgi:Fe-Mn family superoxide dismutase
MSVPGTTLSTPPEAAHQVYPFTLADLPYAYDALEPHIDQKTLQVHHRGHHATYVKKLNETLAKLPELHGLSLAELLASPARIPAAARNAVKDNGGGHLNHDLFWSVLAPPRGQSPQGALARALDEHFGSFGEFRRKFGETAAKHFASGWVALALDRGSGKLEILDLKDHDVVTPGAKAALLILDVWEHAYYVKYQNRRPEFIEAFWNLVNWAHVAERLEHARSRAG